MTHINSMSDAGGGKILYRKVDGQKQMVLKGANGNYYVRAESGGWNQVQYQGRGGIFGLGKKRFESLPEQPKVVQTPIPTATQNAQTVSRTSTPEEIRNAMAGLRDFEKVVDEYNSENPNQEAINLNNLNRSEIANLENGTPVTLSNGENKYVSGTMYNGMLIQKHDTNLGEQGVNYTAIDINAYRTGTNGHSAVIGTCDTYSDGTANVRAYDDKEYTDAASLG